MTCIVGVEHAGGVLIGGDSLATAGWSSTLREDTKVFRIGSAVMGLTGSPREAQLLRYKLNIPEVDLSDVDRYIATSFVDAVRQLYKENGWSKVENNKEAGNGNFLLGIAGRLYGLYADFQFSRSRAGYLAVGCGAELARGSLHTTASLNLTPRERVRLALEASAAHNAGVEGPFTILNHEG